MFLEKQQLNRTKLPTLKETTKLCSMIYEHHFCTTNNSFVIF